MFSILEIENRWNDRLKNIGLSVSIKEQFPINYYSVNFYKISEIDWYRKASLNLSLNLYDEERYLNINDNFIISFTYSYSLSKRCLNRFNKILNQIIENEFCFNNGVEFKYKLKKEDILLPICEEKDLKISNIDYINRKMVFKQKPIFEIMSIIIAIERTLGIINNYFSYDEDGNEISNIKYSVGSIVSLNKDTENDYIIQEYDFTSETYKLSKITFPEKNKEVFLLEDAGNFSEKEIRMNRNFRIDEILN